MEGVAFPCSQHEEAGRLFVTCRISHDITRRARGQKVNVHTERVEVKVKINTFQQNNPTAFRRLLLVHVTDLFHEAGKLPRSVLDASQ